MTAAGAYKTTQGFDLRYNRDGSNKIPKNIRPVAHNTNDFSVGKYWGLEERLRRKPGDDNYAKKKRGDLNPEIDGRGYEGLPTHGYCGVPTKFNTTIWDQIEWNAREGRGADSMLNWVRNSDACGMSSLPSADTKLWRYKKFGVLDRALPWDESSFHRVILPRGFPMIPAPTLDWVGKIYSYINRARPDPQPISLDGAGKHTTMLTLQRAQDLGWWAPKRGRFDKERWEHWWGYVSADWKEDLLSQQVSHMNQIDHIRNYHIIDDYALNNDYNVYDTKELLKHYNLKRTALDCQAYLQDRTRRGILTEK